MGRVVGLLGEQLWVEVDVGGPGRPGRTCWDDLGGGKGDDGGLLAEQLLVEVGVGGVVEGGARMAPTKGHCWSRGCSRGILGRNTVRTFGEIQLNNFEKYSKGEEALSDWEDR